ncbi:FG-GAP-like repeat-containing protein [Shinella curvata]|uniref:FG-GAP-like repeat-containing protein n=1 Tax=Shinella curvata TaxID=1817964 RepID=A0ABT8XN93_9HYPH|nr:FG-GAP-like repeat-containing protein [Shinella curvata]MCJ8057315.1 FG-GAP-like repeat-containing protein [Shinella curvata]MDO6125198.1 FG-GAP-like repeat-containing protein [Shinella curvata]
MFKNYTVKELTLAANVKGSFHETLAIDVDRDGYRDIVWASFDWIKPIDEIPMGVLLNNKIGGFELPSHSLISGEKATTVHARQIVSADFNGDGLIDIFVADHGFDQDPFPGHQNLLLLAKAGGGFKNATDQLPQISDFTHSAGAADIDGDGDIDLYAGNYSSTGTPHFLVNDGRANFEASTVGLPKDLIDGSRNSPTTLFFDADKDGDSDLFLGSENDFPHVLLLNNGAGKFTHSSFPLPKPLFGLKTSTIDSIKFDFNGDKLDDILTLQTGGYVGTKLQVLISDGKGRLIDQTSTYFDRQPGTADWSVRSTFADLNGDGARDLVVDKTGGSAHIYINDGFNHFKQLPLKYLPLDEGGALEVFDINKDGLADLVETDVRDGDIVVRVFKSQKFADGAKIVGSSSADVMLAGKGSQSLLGGKANDFLMGGSGDDSLTGGAGRDKLFGGTGSDTASYADAGKGVLAKLSFSSANSGDAEGDQYFSIENLTGSSHADKLTGDLNENRIGGGDGGDVLNGAAGNDKLFGDSGNDKLYGWTGADRLYGGTGADLFVFTSTKHSTASARDMIHDFSQTQGDRIHLSGIDARAATSKNDAFTFIGEKAFSEKAGELRYFHKSGDTFVSGDVDGDGKADFALRLDNTIDLVKGDFIL